MTKQGGVRVITLRSQTSTLHEQLQYFLLKSKHIVTCLTGGRRYYVTVVERFYGYAHHSVLSRCMATNSE
jgi:hypothetical protein